MFLLRKFLVTMSLSCWKVKLYRKLLPLLLSRARHSRALPVRRQKLTTDPDRNCRNRSAVHRSVIFSTWRQSW